MSLILPTPRDLLTSLISSLASIPITDNTSANNTNSSHKPSNPQPGPSSSTNPLRLIPPAYRPLLTTLHALYPSTLLPALDLLDRRLVTRVVLRRDTPHSAAHVQAGEHQTPADPVLNNVTEEEKEKRSTTITETRNLNPQENKPLYHLVRSAQQQSSGRHQPSTSSSGQVYVVRLESWNCTCAAFAFSAFPPLPSSSPTFSVFPATATASRDTEESDQNWDFGGLSTDGRDVEGTGTADVSCCKHLLACVLAEKWGTVLGGYMEERIVTKEEGAGLVGEV